MVVCDAGDETRGGACRGDDKAMSTAGKFKPQDIANLMWSYATLSMEPGTELAMAMGRRAVLTAGEFKPQNIANLLWACAALGLDYSAPTRPRSPRSPPPACASCTSASSAWTSRPATCMQ